MSKIVYKMIYNRRRKLNSRGEALLQVEALLGHKRCYFNTHIYLTPSQWDKRKRVVRNHPNADGLNYWLYNFVAELEKRELELWQQGHNVTLDMLKSSVRRPWQTDSFLDFYEKEVNRAVLKPSSRHNQLTTLHLLKRYKSEICFCEMTYELVSDFDQWMRNLNYHTNTIAKHIKHLKRYVNLAINQEKISLQRYPFRKYHIKTKEYHHSHLTPEELYLLEQLKLEGRQAGMAHALHAFLFCCYAGLRYSDFTSLRSENLIEEQGRIWLCYRSVKTNVEVRSPIYLLFGGKALQILRLYREDLNGFFTLKGNSNINKQLVSIGKRAGIAKHISFHTARHTHATLLIYSGVNITTVQRLLGHRSVRTTQGYTEVMDSTVVEDLQQHQWKYQHQKKKTAYI